MAQWRVVAPVPQSSLAAQIAIDRGDRCRDTEIGDAPPIGLQAAGKADLRTWHRKMVQEISRPVAPGRPLPAWSRSWCRQRVDQGVKTDKEGGVSGRKSAEGSVVQGLAPGVGEPEVRGLARPVGKNDHRRRIESCRATGGPRRMGGAQLTDRRSESGCLGPSQPNLSVEGGRGRCRLREGSRIPAYQTSDRAGRGQLPRRPATKVANAMRGSQGVGTCSSAEHPDHMTGWLGRPTRSRPRAC